MRRCLLVLVVPALLATACVGGSTGGRVPAPASEEPTVVPTRPRDAVEPTAPPTPGPTGDALPAPAEPLVARAREDLARRLDLPSTAIRLVSVQAVDWPDASLGCPQPGMAYAQVITPGFRLVLEAEDQIYEYHTDTVQLVVLCDERRTSGGAPPRVPDASVEDGWPSQPIEGGHVDTDRITPLAPQDRQ